MSDCLRAEPPETAPPEPAAEAILVSVLERIAERESCFSERFYEIFFALRPDARPLFGVHALAEREEMTRETLRSLHSSVDGEAWLADNLKALGQSHWEYGVTRDMYADHVDAMLACTREILAGSCTAAEAVALRSALEGLVALMREAGEQAEARASR